VISDLLQPWARPFVVAAFGGGIILVASVVGAYCLAGVM